MSSITFNPIVASTSGECSICTDEWQKDEEVSAHGGDHPHTYHTNCIRGWVLQSIKTAMLIDRAVVNPPTCPICKMNITHVNGESVGDLQESLEPNADRGEDLVKAVKEGSLTKVRDLLNEGEIFSEHRILAIQSIPKLNRDGKEILALLLGEDPREEYIETAIVKVAGENDAELLGGLLDGRDLDDSVYQDAVVKAAEKNSLSTLRLLLQFKRASDDTLQSALETAATNKTGPQIEAELIAGRSFTEEFLHGIKVIKATYKGNTRAVEDLLKAGQISVQHRELALAYPQIELNTARALMESGEVTEVFFKKAIAQLGSKHEFVVLEELKKYSKISNCEFYNHALFALAGSPFVLLPGAVHDTRESYEKGLESFLWGTRGLLSWEYDPIMHRALKEAAIKNNGAFFEVTYKKLGGLSKELTEEMLSSTKNPEIVRILLSSNKVSKVCFDAAVSSVNLGSERALDLMSAFAEFGEIPVDIRYRLLNIAVRKSDLVGVQMVLNWGKIDFNNLSYCIEMHAEKYDEDKATYESEYIAITKAILANATEDEDKEKLHGQALRRAVGHARVALVKELLESQYISDNDHGDAVYYAAGREGNFQVLRVLLLNRKISTEIRDYSVIVAFRNGHLDRAKELLEDGEISERVVQECKELGDHPEQKKARNHLLNNRESLQIDGKFKRAARLGDTDQLSEALLNDEGVSLSARISLVGIALNQRDFNMGSMLVKDAVTRVVKPALDYLVGDVFNPLEDEDDE